jgi:hypothetical protein
VYSVYSVYSLCIQLKYEVVVVPFNMK